MPTLESLTRGCPNREIDEEQNDRGPTYMSVSASSNRSGGIDADFGNGSVHFIKNSIPSTSSSPSCTL
jgi:hypothetical protein